MLSEPAAGLAAALLADGPADGVDLSLFGRFAGSWTLDCTEYGSDGTATVRRGEWHFGYALGGTATTDVWILPGVGPGRRRTHTFLAAAVGDGIILDGGDLRWTFSDIATDSLAWRNESQQPGGTWRLQQTFHVWR